MSQAQLTSTTQPVLEHAYGAVAIGKDGKGKKTEVVYNGFQGGRHYVRWTDGQTYTAKRTSTDDKEPEFEFKLKDKAA